MKDPANSIEARSQWIDYILHGEPMNADVDYIFTGIPNSYREEQKEATGYDERATFFGPDD